MTADDARADLAYVRELAEAGHRAPLLGGRFLILWGGLSACAFLGHWMIVTGVLPLGAAALLPLWIGFILAGSVGSWLMGRAVETKPGAGSAGNRFQAAVWPVIGLALFVFFLAVFIGTGVGLLDSAFFNLMLPLGFFGYAIGWLAGAFFVRSVRLAAPGVVALVGMFACVLMINTAEVYLVAAATMLASTFVPGLLMMRGEPKNVV